MGNAGFAFLGAGAGAGLGYTHYAAVLNRWPLETVDAQGTTLMYLLCVFVGALLGASVLLRHKIEVMIGATSLVGAVGSTAALALLLAHVDVKFLGGFKPSLQASHEVYVGTGGGGRGSLPARHHCAVPARAQARRARHSEPPQPPGAAHGAVSPSLLC